MYTKKYTTEDGTEVAETFQSWYDVLKEGWMLSFFYLLIGLIGLVATPFMAIWAIFRPTPQFSSSYRNRTCFSGSEDQRVSGTLTSHSQP